MANAPSPARTVPAADVGWLMVFAASIALLYEVIVAIDSGAYRIIPVGEIWFDLHVPSLNFVQAIVQRYIHPWLWDPLLTSILLQPAWSLLGAPGAILVSLDAMPRTDRC